jgi:hypothetical protein
MPIVRDIISRNSKKILNLKGEITPDLKKPSCSKESTEYTLIARKEKTKKRHYKNLTHFILSAFIIVFILNLAHIANQFFKIYTNIEADAFEGYSNFMEGGKDTINFNLGNAVQSFEVANNAFSKAKNKIWFLEEYGVIKGKQTIGSSAYTILETGEYLSNAASYFAQGLNEFEGIPILFIESNINDTENKQISLTEKLKNALKLFELSFNELLKITNKLEQINPYFFPKKIRGKLQELTLEINKLNITLNKFKKRIPAILTMLGDRYPHRYLILLQNNTESRPTGGFIGSYMIVDVNDGYITKTEFHDIYESDGQLNTFIEPPAEIKNLTENWRMRDSNYSPDFALSAAKAAWFLEKEEGPGVDSVIAINQNILKDLLTITGPIQIDGLKAPLTASNYNTVLTYIVESKLEGETNPKAVINKLSKALKKKLYSGASFRSLFLAIKNGIEKKEILGWSKHKEVQEFFRDIGMSGEIKKTAINTDYFNLITINIGGNKSDLYIEPTILHETFIKKTGEILDKIIYIRKHSWNPKIIDKWKKELEPFGYTKISELLQNILGGGNNKSIIKIYIPPKSIVENVTGINKEEIVTGYDEELDKNYVYFPLEVAPQNESKVEITYKLPYKLDLWAADEYRLVVQKQAGIINNAKFIKRIFSDPRVKNYRNYPEEIVYNENEAIEYEGFLQKDLYFASLWGLN